jgi:hypothetical protein
VEVGSPDEVDWEVGWRRCVEHSDDAVLSCWLLDPIRVRLTMQWKREEKIRKRPGRTSAGGCDRSDRRRLRSTKPPKERTSHYPFIKE